MMDDISDKNSNDENSSTEDKNEVKPIDRMKERKRSKEERSKMKNVKKTGVHLVETVNDVQTLKDKLDVMSKKYSDIVDDNKRLLLNLKQSEKKVVLLLREKEQFQSERNKALLTRKRLENLCRELQKQNKTVKEECLSRLKKEEEKRKELSDNCKSILAHINQQMNLTHEKNEKMQEESLEMNKLFKSLCDQVAYKEQQLMQEHLRTKNELYIACNKLEEFKIEATVEKEVFLREKQQLLLTINEYRTRIDELQAVEAAMKTQLDLYTNKYDEFQNCLKRSNKVCGEFNEEMERMSKKILTLEKETCLWKQRWEQSNAVFVDMASQKQARDLELIKLKEKLALLQNLCRVFQQEKKSLVAQLNEKNAKTNNDSTTRESSKNSKSKEKGDHSKKESISLESNKSKEKDDPSKKDSTSLENINEQLAPTNVVLSLEQRLETESNTDSTTEKKQEINEDEEMTNPPIEKCSLSSEPCSEDTNLSSQENRIEEQEKISSDVEIVVENSSKTEPSIAELSSVISNENINESEVVETENKEAIDRISDTSCDNVTELESSSENTVNESTVQISISTKEDVQTEKQNTESSNQENNTEKLIENIENKCTDLAISTKLEPETMIEQCVSTNLSKDDVTDKPLEPSNDELDIKLDDKLEEEINISIENIQEIEKPESDTVKDSTEVNPSVEKKVKIDTPCSKEDNKSTKQNFTTATKGDPSSFLSNLVAGCTWRATLGTCVFQSDFGFALNCAFKKSGLFRVRNLGGVKGYLGLGFTVGDELGFRESLSNVESARRRSVQAGKTGLSLGSTNVATNRNDNQQKARQVVPPFKPLPVGMSRPMGQQPERQKLVVQQNSTTALRTVAAPSLGTQEDMIKYQQQQLQQEAKLKQQQKHQQETLALQVLKQQRQQQQEAMRQQHIQKMQQQYKQQQLLNQQQQQQKQQMMVQQQKQILAMQTKRIQAAIAVATTTKAPPSVVSTIGNIVQSDHLKPVSAAMTSVTSNGLPPFIAMPQSSSRLTDRISNSPTLLDDSDNEVPKDDYNQLPLPGEEAASSVNKMTLLSLQPIATVDSSQTLPLQLNEKRQSLPASLPSLAPIQGMETSLKALADASNITLEALEAAILLRQQQLMQKQQGLGTTSTTTTTTTTIAPLVKNKYTNTGITKVMNAPNEYYPIGYDKNFDDNFASRVDLPDTSFYCGDQKHFPGLYADEDLGCMVFHVCALTDDGLIMKSFLCPESTLFDQTILKCNWWFYVDCTSSKSLYDSNIPISKSYQLMKALAFFSAYKNHDNGTVSTKDNIDSDDTRTS
ncbi:hypothetical protein M0802_008028 [Mischocyttarus mexicanus]|nr:hypothetical protein M0802_008028 [Mischocyttarus mexicanus]